MNQRSLIFMILLFSLLCLSIFSFLQIFTVVDGEMIYLTWEEAARINSDGTLTPMDPDETGLWSGLDDGQWYRVSASIENLPQNSYLLLETSGIDQIIRFQGKELTASSSSYPFENLAFSDAKIQVPLPGAEQGGILEIDFRVTNPIASIFPPLARTTTQKSVTASDFGYANWSALPAGASAMVFFLICGLFFMGLFYRKPDWTLLLLLPATLILIFRNLIITQGYYFLPSEINHLFTQTAFQYLTPILLLGYLILRRKENTLTQLKNVTLGTVAALMIFAGISYFLDGYLFHYLQELTLEFSYGYYDNVLYWITLYLALTCAGISIYCFTRNYAQTKADSQTLELQNRLMMQNYQDLSEKNRQTAKLRHEWKKQLTALNYIQKSGNSEKLEEKLQELTNLLDTITPRDFTEHFSTNSILQYADSKARQAGISFSATAIVPADLAIDESDLCTLLLNMLDNALEAAAKVPQGKITCRIQYLNGFFSVFCENTFDSQLWTDETGQIRTRKVDPQIHGFGLEQMHRVAKKYHSLLDISYDDTCFTVQTSLKL